MVFGAQLFDRSTVEPGFICIDEMTLLLPKEDFLPFLLRCPRHSMVNYNAVLQASVKYTIRTKTSLQKLFDQLLLMNRPHDFDKA